MSRAFLTLLLLLGLPTGLWADCVRGDCVNGRGRLTDPDGRKVDLHVV